MGKSANSRKKSSMGNEPPDPGADSKFWKATDYESNDSEQDLDLRKSMMVSESRDRKLGTKAARVALEKPGKVIKTGNDGSFYRVDPANNQNVPDLEEGKFDRKYRRGSGTVDLGPQTRNRKPRSKSKNEVTEALIEDSETKEPDAVDSMLIGRKRDAGSCFDRPEINIDAGDVIGLISGGSELAGDSRKRNLDRGDQSCLERTEKNGVAGDGIKEMSSAGGASMQPPCRTLTEVVPLVCFDPPSCNVNLQSDVVLEVKVNDHDRDQHALPGVEPLIDQGSQGKPPCMNLGNSDSFANGDRTTLLVIDNNLESSNDREAVMALMDGRMNHDAHLACFDPTPCTNLVAKSQQISLIGSTRVINIKALEDVSHLISGHLATDHMDKVSGTSIHMIDKLKDGDHTLFENDEHPSLDIGPGKNFGMGTHVATFESMSCNILDTSPTHNAGFKNITSM
jgi:hypothetical protein